MTANDLITLSLFFILFGMCAGASAYYLGLRHGYEAGYLAGSANEITRLKPRVIQAKREAAAIARQLCMAELLHGSDRKPWRN